MFYHFLFVSLVFSFLFSWCVGWIKGIWREKGREIEGRDFVICISNGDGKWRGGNNNNEFLLFFFFETNPSIIRKFYTKNSPLSLPYSFLSSLLPPLQWLILSCRRTKFELISLCMIGESNDWIFHEAHPWWIYLFLSSLWVSWFRNAAH